VASFVPHGYHQAVGLIRKAIFLGTAATGTPLVRWNSSAEAAAKKQQRLMQEQNDILSQMANQQNDLDDDIDDDFDDDYEPPVRVVSQSDEQGAEPSLTDRLTEIRALLDKGVITADEHAAMRKKILGV
jgi:hypothetical protein